MHHPGTFNRFPEKWQPIKLKPQVSPKLFLYINTHRFAYLPVHCQSHCLYSPWSSGWCRDSPMPDSLCPSTVCSSSRRLEAECPLPVRAFRTRFRSTPPGRHLVSRSCPLLCPLAPHAVLGLPFWGQVAAKMVTHTRNPGTLPLFLLPPKLACFFHPRSLNPSWRVCPGLRLKAFSPVSAARSRWDSLG